jgi:pimeloyl-ACP methyl ester carboxylesterase
MRFEDLVADFRSWVDRQGLGRFTMIGHGLGGKVAMRFACRHSVIVDALVVMDVSPKSYRPYHLGDFAVMNELDLNSVSTMGEARTALEAEASDRSHGRFLLTNLVRDPDGGFRWSVNLPVLMESQMVLAGDSLEGSDRFSGPVLFVRGARSEYVKDFDRDCLARYFPAYILSTIRDAGHYLHIDNQTGFVESLRYFRDHHLAGAR